MVRLIWSAALGLVLALVLAIGRSTAVDTHASGLDTPLGGNADALVTAGRTIFRFDTFGDEQLWTNVLRMHEVLTAVDPATALSLGLKVDSDALPPEVTEAIRSRTIDLTDPVITLALLQLNAVVGVKGVVNANGQLTSVGITCALCHSSVDDSVAPGIGRRLDGWANSRLDVGFIVALSPALDEGTKTEFRRWGPGKYDPRHHAFDGLNIIPLNNPSVPVVLPPVYGLRGVGFETFTGDGPISYWNSYVGVGQMGGQGTFFDPRLPLFITQRPDLVTPKLPALLAYQLSLRTPPPPPGTFDPQAAARGERLFRTRAGCVRCHRGSTFTDVLSGPSWLWPRLHEAEEVGTDGTYASRSATGRYRTTPLRGLWQHAPYFHDGSARDLPAVVEHYDRHLGLRLRADQKTDLVEYLKSL